jgi:uncharacterized protein
MSLAFEWDDEKARANIAKHGVDFVDAAQIFAGSTLQYDDDREDYGERRVRAIGEHDGMVYVVIFTPRRTRLRIISAWKAGKDDRTRYHARVAR